MQSDARLRRAAIGVAVATFLSGPVGLALTALAPQPPWADVETYAAHQHPLQQLPFWFGFVLIGASVYFVACAAARAEDRHRAHVLTALVCVAAYAATIGVNYLLQIAVVPYFARTRDPLLGYVTMTNPAAMSWTLEMFGYAWLGVATWLLAPTLRHRPRGALIHGLLAANGVVSLAGAGLSAWSPTWVLTTPGMISFALWNALFIVTMLLIGRR